MTSVSINVKARIAGLLYLLLILTGIFSLMYVPSKLIVWDNASLTFEKIVASETLFRLGIVSGLACYFFFFLLALVLYQILNPINKNYAKLMVLLVVMSIPMFFINVQNEFTVLSLINDASLHQSFSPVEVESHVMLYLHEYDNGLSLVHIFSGLWLFPFGYLVFKSGFLPRILGILLMIGCFGYLADFLGATLFKNYSEKGISMFVTLPATIGEIGICLWLLVFGVNRKINNS